MKPGLLLLLTLVVCGACTPLLPASDVPATAVGAETSPSPWDPFKINSRLGRGVNLGNALEAPREGEWGMTLDESYFRLIADAGFDSVRIPIRWSAHASDEAPYTIDPGFLERLDWAVDRALANGLLPIVDLHHYEEMAINPDDHRERFLALWRQIAEHYRDAPPEVVFELMNEPNGAMTRTRWNDLIAAALPVIRDSNPQRAVIIGPAGWYGINELPGLELPESDRNIIASVHYYSPFEFTHQGAEWVDGSDAWLGTTWRGTEAQRAVVSADLSRAAQWGREHDRPLYLGEFGAYSKADMGSRARWTEHVARSAEALGMSWGYWEFGAGFGVYDRTLRRWTEDLLRALIPEADSR
jgi:endoglucanase